MFKKRPANETKVLSTSRNRYDTRGTTVLFQALLDGDKERACPTGLQVKRDAKDRFTVSIINSRLEELVRVCEVTVRVGDTLNLMDIHRAFDVKIVADIK